MKIRPSNTNRTHSVKMRMVMRFVRNYSLLPNRRRSFSLLVNNESQLPFDCLAVEW